MHKHHKHDQALAMALHIIEEEKCQSCGLPIWIGHSEDARIDFELDHVVCWGCVFEDAETNKPSYTRKKGHTPFVKPILEQLEPGVQEKWPTRTDFIEDRVKKAIAAAEFAAKEAAASA